MIVEQLSSTEEWIITTKPRDGINNQFISFEDIKTGKSKLYSVKVITAYNTSLGYWEAKSFELIPVQRISQ